MNMDANNFEYKDGLGFEYKQFRLVKRRVGKSGLKKVLLKVAGSDVVGNGTDDFCDDQSQTRSLLIVGAIVWIPTNQSYFTSTERPPQPTEPIVKTTQMGYFIRHYGTGHQLEIGLNDNLKVQFSPVINVIPRCHRIDQEIITCMGIFQSRDSERVKDKERSHWTRFLDSGFKILENESFGFAFHELNFKECVKKLREISDEMKDKNNTRSYVGIYVSKNTSLLMIDTFKDINADEKDHERTLFQEGSVIILENMELRYNRFRYTKKNIKILNFDELGLNHKMRANPFFILRPVLEAVNQTTQPSLSSWGLKITHEIRNDKKIAVLQIPQNTEFERVYEWEDGMTNVIKKMKAKPWDKYVCIEGQNNTNFPIHEFNGPYPGFKENSIEDRDWSEESESDHESHDSESRIVLTVEEREYITRLNSYKESRTETNTRTAYQAFKDWTETIPDEGSSQK